METWVVDDPVGVDPDPDFDPDRVEVELAEDFRR